MLVLSIPIDFPVHVNDVNVHLNESLERFTANGKHEFLPRDQGFP